MVEISRYSQFIQSLVSGAYSYHHYTKHDKRTNTHFSKNIEISDAMQGAFRIAFCPGLR